MNLTVIFTRLKGLAVLLFLALAVQSCLVFQTRKTLEKVVNDLDKNPAVGRIIKRSTDSAAKGAIDGLHNDSAKIKALAKLLIAQLDDGTKKISKNVRDSLLSKATSAWLKTQLDHLSAEGQKTLIKIISNDTLSLGMRKISAALRDELLGEVTLQKVSLLRDSLLGKKTRLLVDSLIHSSLSQLASEYDSSWEKKLFALLEKFDSVTNKSLDKVKQTVTQWEITAGVIGLLLIIVGAVAYRMAHLASKHKKAAFAMMRVIDQLPRDDYDRIAPAVSIQAQHDQISAHLNSLLDQAALHERTTHQKIQKQALEVYLQMNAPGQKKLSDELEQEAKKTGTEFYNFIKEKNKKTNQ
ncbi:MAG: hypothetical protein JSS79_01135 [Bacteroidetes bacterium]|nr:hypothetical protein [Bacteroidota bacterium]